MGEQAKPQAGGTQATKPKARSRKKRIAVAALVLLAVGLGTWAIWHYATRRPEITLDLGNNVKIRLVLIPAGTFMMGSPGSEAERGDDEAQHEVTISKPFYMGIYEVTQEQYKAVMGANPSHFKGATNPVDSILWDDAAEFCRRLSAKTGRRVVLPTEAQWEYACRAGTTTPYNTGESIGRDQANILCPEGPSPGSRFNDWIGKVVPQAKKADEPMAVGSFKPNSFGLYDMHGNVEEWCSDWCEATYYSVSPKTDPQGPSSGEWRVLRGGAWIRGGGGLSRSAFRHHVKPVRRDPAWGFRVVVVAD